MTILYESSAAAAHLGLDQISLGDLPAVYRKFTGDREAMGFDNGAIMTAMYGPFEFSGVSQVLKVRLRGWKETGAGAGDCPLDVHLEARTPGGAGTGVAPSWGAANSGTLLLPAEDRLEQLTLTITNDDSATAGDEMRLLVRRPSAGSLAALAWLEWIAVVDEA